MQFRIATSRWKALTLVATCALACAAPGAAADEFTPGVTDFPSRLANGETSAKAFIPGVTDVPNALASATSALSKRIISSDGAMPRAMPSDYITAGVELPTARVPAGIAPVVADRFDWLDAGVGAAIAAGALVLIAGAGFATRSRVVLARSGAQGA